MSLQSQKTNVNISLGNYKEKKRSMNIEKISKVYNTKNTYVEAIKEISYQFEQGKFYAIMGHSGSGKSTFIHLLGLLETPTSGKYTLNGKKCRKLDRERNCKNSK